MRTTLSDCPTEVGSLILRELQDFSALFAAVQTCRFLRDSFRSNELRILRSIIQRKCSHLETYRYGSVLRDLICIVRQDIVSRDCARFVFEDCWLEFKRRSLEELLIPVGIALARSYAQVNRTVDSLALLENIWHGNVPFGWSADVRVEQGKKLATLSPLGQSMAKLSHEEESDPVSTRDLTESLQSDYDGLHVAVVAGSDLYLDPEPYRDTSGDLQANGIQFLGKTKYRTMGYCRKPVGNFPIFWMRVTHWPSHLPLGRPFRPK